MEDQQAKAPMAWCQWCGRELYPGEEMWVLDGASLHRECVADFALAHCQHRLLEEKRRGIW